MRHPNTETDTTAILINTTTAPLRRGGEGAWAPPGGYTCRLRSNSEQPAPRLVAVN